jgi:beta-mannosidase
MHRKLLNWKLGYCAEYRQKPCKFIDAIVPGAVQLDIANAENFPDYKFSDNYKLFRHLEDMFYTYRSEFEKPYLSENERLYFVSKGIDYQFEIYLNSQLLHSQDGMFTYIDLDLTVFLAQQNILEIKIMPAPKKNGHPDDRTQASEVTKPAVSYGWDWHPRLIPLGIWDETFLETRPASHLTDVFVDYHLTENFTMAKIILNATAILKSECNYEWQLVDNENNNVLSLSGAMSEILKEKAVLSSPNLWWTHDHGIPYLYRSLFVLKDKSGIILSRDEQKIGFRCIKLVMNKGAWNEPVQFPKTQSVPPAQLLLNGKRLFAKGTNWVNPEIFPGAITESRYRELLEMAVNTNFNILRSWGGAIVNKEPFFNICDELGIMVWQEFPLACNQYPDDNKYLKILEREAVSVIKRLRKHPSIALWCGGNELFNNWSRMTEQSIALRLLNSLCLQYDSNRPFLSTSPLLGMAHGNYVFKWEGHEIFEVINNSHNTAYCEFGIPSISPKSVLQQIIPAGELFPPKENTAWETHHAFKSWDADESTWLCLPILTEYFGEAQSLDELIEQSQLLQNEGYKAIYEEARRQKPYCSMALNWCFNEPWPSAANNSLIVYPSVPKPALQAVKNACRPVCASARFSKFVWNAGELFCTDIWLLNDSFKEVDSKTIIIKIQFENEEIIILKWISPVAAENTNLVGPMARYKLPYREKSTQFKILIQVVEKPEYNSEYTLLFRNKENKQEKTKMNV